LLFLPPLTPLFFQRIKLTNMERIENIVDYNAELFIKKHFSNLNENDKMVKAMRSSVKDTIKRALAAYDGGRFKQ